MSKATAAEESGANSSEQARKTDATPDESVTPSTADRALVSKVVRSVELAEVRLDWCRAAVNCRHEHVPDDWAERVEIVFDVHHKNDQRRAGHFEAQVFWLLSWDRPDESRNYEVVEDHDVEIGAVVALTYRLTDGADIDDEALEHFAAFNATFNAWSYWREFAQSMSTRLQLTPYVAPVLRVPSLTSPPEPTDN